jgi:hypothetical protein
MVPRKWECPSKPSGPIARPEPTYVVVVVVVVVDGGGSPGTTVVDGTLVTSKHLP